MKRRHRVGRALAALGALVLFASACVHSLHFPELSAGLSASGLPAALQAVSRIAFLAMAWHSLVLGSIVLLAIFAETRLRKVLVLICGAAILAETGLTFAFVGLFIGNELIGTAGLLLVCGGLLLERGAPSNAQQSTPIREISATVQSPS